MSITYHLFLDQFGETEWLSSAELERYQERRLARLIRHARNSVEAYRDLPEDMVRDDDRIDWRAWQDVPAIGRADIADQAHAFLSADVPTDHGEINYRLSEEGPDQVAIAGTEYSTLTDDCMQIRLCAWHGIEPTQPLAVLAPGDEEEAGFWGAGFRAMEVPGRRRAFDSGRSDKELLTALVAYQPAAIEGGPADIERLCELVRHAGIELRPRAVLVTGAPMPETLPRRSRRAFGVSPVAAYRVPEIGTLAISCPESGAYHLMGDNAFIEILDEDDRPVPIGGAGRVVVTSYFNFAMPLLRYDTGDIAMTGAACTCGRCLPTVSRIVWRGDITSEADQTSA